MLSASWLNESYDNSKRAYCIISMQTAMAVDKPMILMSEKTLFCRRFRQDWIMKALSMAKDNASARFCKSSNQISCHWKRHDVGNCAAQGGHDSDNFTIKI